MIIALTGGTGFVGRHLAKRLIDAGHTVRILSRKKIVDAIEPAEYFHGSLDEQASLNEFIQGADVVCNCAGEINDEDRLHATNYIGVQNLFKVAKVHQIKRFIQLSSVGVYGEILSGTVDESTELCAMNPYEASKIAADQWLLAQQEPQVEICLLRPCAVLGRDMPNNSFRALVSAVRKRLFFCVGRDYLASYISIENLTHAFVLAVEHSNTLHHKVYNLSDALAWQDIFAAICRGLEIKRRCLSVPKPMAQAISYLGERLLGNKFPLKQSRVSALTRKTMYDSSAIARDLDYQPLSSLSDSIENYVRAWYENDTPPENTPIKLARVVASPVFLAFHLKGQIDYLVDNGVDMHLVSPKGEELNSFSWQKSLHHETLNVGKAINPFKDLMALFKLIAYFRKEKFDIIHSSMPKAGLLCVLAALFSRSTIVIHTFTGQVWATQKGFARKLFKFFDKVIITLADKVYADSHSQARLILDNITLSETQKVSVLGEGSIAGVDLNRFDIAQRPVWRKKIRNELAISSEEFVFVFVGRINQGKGIFELLSAFSKIPAARLIICGPNELESDEQRNRFSDQIANNKNIDFLGKIYNPEQFYAAADMLVLPSYREGFGSVVIEAAAMGIPTIGTRITGLVDAIVDGVTGILVDKQSSKQLAQKMQYCLEHSADVDRMAMAAYNRAKNDFSISHLSKLQLAEYKLLTNDTQSLTTVNT
jgi:nucleoside-diphosphate-sugar epimerase/glycosyltransferase involved in cell wall biosynthesis